MILLNFFGYYNYYPHLCGAKHIVSKYFDVHLIMLTKLAGIFYARLIRFLDIRETIYIIGGCLSRL